MVKTKTAVDKFELKGLDLVKMEFDVLYTAIHGVFCVFNERRGERNETMSLGLQHQLYRLDDAIDAAIEAEINKPAITKGGKGQ